MPAMSDRSRWSFSRVALYVFVGVAFGLATEPLRPLLEPRWIRSLVTIALFVIVFTTLGWVLNRVDTRHERTRS